MNKDKVVSYDQPTSAPTPKVASVGVSGAIVTVVVLIASMLGVELPKDVQDNIAGLVAGVVALTSLVNFVVAYYKRDAKPLSAVKAIQGER